jgi:hypothetical protein
LFGGKDATGRSCSPLKSQESSFTASRGSAVLFGRGSDDQTLPTGLAPEFNGHHRPRRPHRTATIAITTISSTSVKPRRLK